MERRSNDYGRGREGRGGGRGGNDGGYARGNGRGGGGRGRGYGHQQQQHYYQHQRQGREYSQQWTSGSSGGIHQQFGHNQHQNQQQQSGSSRWRSADPMTQVETVRSPVGSRAAGEGGGHGRRRGGNPAPTPAPVVQCQTPSSSSSPGNSDKLIPVNEPDSSKIVPVKRPDEGGRNNIRPVRLLVNHFRVNYSPESIIRHYDVDVKPEMPPENGRPVKIDKDDLCMIRNQLSSDYSLEIPLSMTAYDGKKNIFSAMELPTESSFKVEVSKGEDTNVRSYIITLKLVNELRLSKLSDYIRGTMPSIPRDVLQGMDLVMKENPTRNMISVGRNFYPTEHDPRDDLGRGIAAFLGFQPSLKPTCQGLALCVDCSVLAFRKRMAVIDFLNEHIRGFDINDFGKFRREVEEALGSLKVYVTHRRTKQKYTISGLTKDITRDCEFDVQDPDGRNPPEKIRLVDYFRERYNKDIEYEGIPSLDLGKKRYVPMELCELVEGQRYQKEHLDRNAAIMLKDISLPSPRDRANMICDMVQSEIGPCGGDVTQNFGFEVNMNMTTVAGRTLKPPELKLGSPNGVMTITVDNEKCQWNLVGKSVVEGKPIRRWAILDFSSNSDPRFKLYPAQFVPKFINRCKSLGIEMEQPLFNKPASMINFSNLNSLRKLLESIYEQACKKRNGDLQVLLCIMSEEHRGYNYLKWISETKIGIMTQCCLSSYANKANDQYLANLGIKINAKLGGCNVELSESLPLLKGAGHTMFLGADVNHPGSRTTTTPSIAAVVGSMKWPSANRYAARIQPQDNRCEKILCFGDMCWDLVETYEQQNKVKPEKIIVFRDGVSEGQFDMVLNEELLDLKRVFQTRGGYCPSITLIVAQKRHQTRLFPRSRQDGSSSGNVSPGTVVDTTIVDPFGFDFYLCSHYGNLGTSKPTHYRVLWDDHKFTSDQLQKLIYDMCFTMARCTKPVSLVPPVYYADLAAYRGRLYYEAAMMEGQSPTSAASMSVFKLHPRLENEMFFI